MTVKITINVNLKAGVKFDSEANVFVAYTPALGVYSQGLTLDRAKLALEDAVKSFLLVAHKNSLLKKCLKNSGFMAGIGSLKEFEKCGQEYISITEEKILEEKNFGSTFDIAVPLPFAEAVA